MNLKLMVPAVALTAIFTGGLVPTDAQAATTSVRARVIRWVDGDTVETTRGTVRLIGMDTPERGHPCYRRATRNAVRLAPAGSRIRLVRVLGRDNTDHYGRKLRYVQRHRRDVGYRQIVHGLADARYDDGSYGTHPRRAKYRRADAVYPDQTCTPPPPQPPPPPPPCSTGYTPCLPPPPPDLDCADIGQEVAVNHAYGDPHNLDADGDGWGCESYG
jgi:endonuclease YncB( thermonuclease family)